MVKLYFNNPLWKVPSTWRSTYNFDGVIKRLSKETKAVLRDAIANNNTCSCNKQIFKSLIKLNLCNDLGELTHEGIVTSIALLPLERQAEILSLPINKLELNYKNAPEIDVMKYLLTNNYQYVCYSEGGIIMTLIFCMCFKEIYQNWQQHPWCKEYGKDYAISYLYSGGILSYEELLEFNPELPKYLLDSILKANEDDIVKAFTIIRKWHKDMGWSGDNWPFRDWSGLSLELLLAVYKILNNKKLTSIAKVFFTDPYAFGKGWPDLLAIDENNRLMLSEVKTTDKLYVSQIINIAVMADFIPTAIIKLSKIKS